MIELVKKRKEGSEGRRKRGIEEGRDEGILRRFKKFCFNKCYDASSG